MKFAKEQDCLVCCAIFLQIGHQPISFLIWSKIKVLSGIYFLLQNYVRFLPYPVAFVEINHFMVLLCPNISFGNTEAIIKASKPTPNETIACRAGSRPTMILKKDPKDKVQAAKREKKIFILFEYSKTGCFTRGIVALHLSLPGK